MILNWRGLFNKEPGGHTNFRKQTEREQQMTLHSYIPGRGVQTKRTRRRGYLLGSGEGKELKPGLEEWERLGQDWGGNGSWIQQP